MIDVKGVGAEEQIKLGLEGLKLVVATSSGFIIAFASEPIKLFFTHFRKRHNLRTALYKEILIVQDNLEIFVEQSRQGISLNAALSLPPETYVYDYAMKEPLLFYELREATDLKQIYIDIKQLLSGIQSNNMSKENTVRACEAVLSRIRLLTQSERIRLTMIGRTAKELYKSRK